MVKSPRIFHALQQANASLFRAADSELRTREGITTSHQVILFVLTEEDGLPSSEIAKRSGMSKSRLTGLVDTLVAKRLVLRAQGQTDARQQLLHITDDGRALIARTRQWVTSLNKALLDPFDPAERETISRFLQQAQALASTISKSGS